MWGWGGGLEYLQNGNRWRPAHATHHLHRMIERLAARGSDATCQESWQLSDAPNIAEQQARGGSVAQTPSLIYLLLCTQIFSARSCKTVALQLCVSPKRE